MLNNLKRLFHKEPMEIVVLDYDLYHAMYSKWFYNPTRKYMYFSQPFEEIGLTPFNSNRVLQMSLDENRRCKVVDREKYLFYILSNS